MSAESTTGRTIARSVARTDTGRVVAVIDAGSSAIRMVVAEIYTNGSWRRLDGAVMATTLGRDVFKKAQISAATTRQVISVLDSFRESLANWQVKPENIRCIATTAVREARNRDMFLDRVAIATGFNIEVIAGVEENQLAYLAVRDALRGMHPHFGSVNSLVIEVGGGSTELILLQKGKIIAAHSLRIGFQRAEWSMRPGQAGDPEQLGDYLREHVGVSLAIMESELPLSQIEQYIAVSSSVRVIAAQIGSGVDGRYAAIDRDAFSEFVRRWQRHSVENIVAEFGVPYSEGEGFIMSLKVVESFMAATAATQIIAPDTSIRDGMLIGFMHDTTKSLSQELHRQTMASIRGLGRKYRINVPHAEQVRTLALSLFQQLETEHALDEHCRLLLEAAAYLHDIGNYIRASGHHKHGQYIIVNSELFGLSRTDVRLVAQTVRYHRKALPNTNHAGFITLRREHRLIVMKLAAILRVADALDRGHRQAITEMRVQNKEGDRLVLECTHVGELTLEKIGLQNKRDLFEEVFGYRVVLRAR